MGLLPRKSEIQRPHAQLGRPTDKILFRLLCPVIASLDKMGILVGYGGGLWIKKALLELEHRFASPQSVTKDSVLTIRAIIYLDWSWGEVGMAVL